MPTTHRCTLLGGLSRELHSADYSWGISTKLPRAYNTESRELQPRIGMLSFGGSTTSLVHYIQGALATALGVLTFEGHNGCISQGGVDAKIGRHPCARHT
jgi:hypothetical protein